MSTQSRLEMHIDVFEKSEQRALPLPNLTATDLVAAILQEFRELEYLSDAPADYQLLRADDQSPLDEDEKLSEQLTAGAHLTLVEHEKPLPAGTQRPSQSAYLRELASGKVYKLHWQPAIIGRPDKNQPHDDRVAVDLETYKTGLRVSRRHAQITEKDGIFYINSLSRNPTVVEDIDGNSEAITAEKRPLTHGDVIHLQRSDISLKFLTRP